MSSAHNVAPKGKWLAFISTTAETANPQGELEAAFAKLGPIEKKFVYTQDVFHPKADLPTDNVNFTHLVYCQISFFRSSLQNRMMLQLTLRLRLKIL